MSTSKYGPIRHTRVTSCDAGMSGPCTVTLLLPSPFQHPSTAARASAWASLGYKRVNSKSHLSNLLLRAATPVPSSSLCTTAPHGKGTSRAVARLKDQYWHTRINSNVTYAMYVSFLPSIPRRFKTHLIDVQCGGADPGNVALPSAVISLPMFIYYLFPNIY
jgi:hypothetical protein